MSLGWFGGVKNLVEKLDAKELAGTFAEIAIDIQARAAVVSNSRSDIYHYCFVPSLAEVYGREHAKRIFGDLAPILDAQSRTETREAAASLALLSKPKFVFECAKEGLDACQDWFEPDEAHRAFTSLRLQYFL